MCIILISTIYSPDESEKARVCGMFMTYHPTPPINAEAQIEKRLKMKRKKHRIVARVGGGPCAAIGC